MPELESDLGNLNKKLVAINAQLDVRSFSTKMLSGAILQIAKQGLSICFGKEKNCPIVREIAGERLSSVIFCARNQSLHYEEGIKNIETIKCFTNLENKFGLKVAISHNININLADIVVMDILKWYCYNDFYQDMIAFK